jgi:hypothetical protein
MRSRFGLVVASALLGAVLVDCSSDAGSSESQGGSGGSGGSCGQETALVSLKTTDTIEDVTVSGSTLFFSLDSFQGDDQILTVPTTGGTPTVLAVTDSAPFGVVVDATSVYWIEATSLWRIAKTGGTAQKVVTAANAVDFTHNLAVDDTYLYFNYSGVNRVDKTATGLSATDYDRLAIDSANSLVLDGDSVYFTTDHEVIKVAKTGGSESKLAEGLSRLNALAVCGGQVVFIDSGDGNGGGQRLFKVPTGGGAMVQLGDTFSGTLDAALGCDGSYIYFASEYFDIMRVALTGGTPEQFACNSGGYQMALDASSLYWVGYNSQKLFTIAK